MFNKILQLLIFSGKIVTSLANNFGWGYTHDGRADKNPYPHDRRADKDSYPHDRMWLTICVA